MSVLGALVVVVALSACSRHKGDFPSVLGVTAPPVPSSFVVATTDFIVHDLSWNVSDPSSIAYYRVYVVDVFTGFPALQDTTAATSVQLQNSPPVALPGLVFGVSSVSVENIESTIVFASAP